MAVPQAKSAGHTLDEWRHWEGRWELIHGVAYDMTPAPGIEHQRASGTLFGAIFNALSEARSRTGQGGCEVFAAPVDVFLGDNVVQPDIVVVCDAARLNARGVEGSPDLVVEILSPSTAGKDVTRKWWLYEASGVPEYLIVDPTERVGRLLRLQQDKYQDAAHVEWGELAALLGGRITVRLGSID